MMHNFVNDLGKIFGVNEEKPMGLLSANANAEIDNLQQELIKKTDEQSKEQEEILRLSYDVSQTLDWIINAT